MKEEAIRSDEELEMTVRHDGKLTTLVAPVETHQGCNNWFGY